MQFTLVICGLDSIEARRWINSTLVDMVDLENPDSFKPLIDGGTEGMYLALCYRRIAAKEDVRFQGPVASYLPNYDILH